LEKGTIECSRDDWFWTAANYDQLPHLVRQGGRKDMWVAGG
jgi:hypothetical protein